MTMHIKFPTATISDTIPIWVDFLKILMKQCSWDGVQVVNFRMLKLMTMILLVTMLTLAH